MKNIKKVMASAMVLGSVIAPMTSASANEFVENEAIETNAVETMQGIWTENQHQQWKARHEEWIALRDEARPYAEKLRNKVSSVQDFELQKLADETMNFLFSETEWDGTSSFEESYQGLLNLITRTHKSFDIILRALDNLWTEEQFQRWESARDEFIRVRDFALGLQMIARENFSYLLNGRGVEDFTSESIERLRIVSDNPIVSDVGGGVDHLPTTGIEFEIQAEGFESSTYSNSRWIENFKYALENLQEKNPSYTWTTEQFQRWEIARDNFIASNEELIQLRSVDFQEWFGGRDREEFTSESVRNLWEAFGMLMIEIDGDVILPTDYPSNLRNIEEQINDLEELDATFSRLIREFEYALGNLELLHTSECEESEVPEESITPAPTPEVEREEESTTPQNNDSLPEVEKGEQPSNNNAPRSDRQTTLPQAGQGVAIAPLLGLGSIVSGLILNNKKK